MYSEVDFGWPATIMSPSLPTSTPTESMLVASSTSIGGFGACCPNGGNLTFIRSSTSGISVADLREVSSSTACGSRSFSVLLVQRLPGGERRHVDADQCRLQPPPWRTHAHVQASGRRIAHGQFPREEIGAGPQSRRRKNAHLPVEQRRYLCRRAPHRCRRCDHLGTNLLAIHLPGGQLIHCTLVDPNQAAQWTAD